MSSKRFPGFYASLSEIANFVKTAAIDLGFKTTELFAIETAVDEAVSNIIEHAYEGEGKGEILCSVDALPDGIKIVLEDHGKPFDPSCIPMPDVSAELNDRQDHGLGIFMMFQLLDDVHFDFLPDRNRLTLIKKKPTEPIQTDISEQLPVWKHFLSLGEELLMQPNALAIQQKFANRIANELDCSAQLWLGEPYYPLPGEPEIQTLPTKHAPLIVQQAWAENKTLDSSSFSLTTELRLCELAIPLITHRNTLGVLHVTRAHHKPFTDDEKQQLFAMAAFAALSMQVNRQEVLKNWRYDQIALVRSVSSQIANVLDLDELCKRVTNLIQCSFNYYHVALFTLEEGSEKLKFRASSLDCMPGIDSPLVNVTLGSGLIGEVAMSGNEIVAKDVTQEPRYRYYEGLPDTKSEAVLPLLVENRVLGVLDVQSSAINAFHETDLLVVRSLADNIALAVEGARLYQKLQERAEQMSAVAEINLALTSILDLEELLKEIVKVIHERFSIPLVHIYTVHPGRRKIIFQAGSGKRAEKLKINSFAFDLDSPLGMIPNVARTGKSMLSNDVSQEPLFRPSKNAPNETKSEMTIPLKFGDTVLGVLDLQSNEIGKFNQSQLDLFEGLAAGIALSIRNATLFRTENWRRKVAETFKDVAGLLSSNLALDALLEKILSQLEHTLPCDASAIWLLDDEEIDGEDHKTLRLAAVRGVNRSQVIKAREESDAVKDFLNMAIEKKEPVTRSQTDPHGPLGTAADFQSDYSSIAVPLLSGDVAIGALTMAHHATGRYGSEASSIASTFASYAAVAIENARLYTHAQEDAWSSTVLLQVAEAMQTITNADDLLATMTRLTPLLVGINQCAFILFDENDQAFHLRTWYGFTPSQEEKILHDDQCLALLKMRLTKEPVFITDPPKEMGMSSLFLSPDSGTMVLIPLISHSEIFGGFLVSHDSLGEFGIRNLFNDQTLAILQGIARQTSIALENIRLIENRQEEAYITAVLLQVAQAVVSQNKLDDIIDTITHLMPILIGVEMCVICLKDEKSSAYIVKNAIAPTHAQTQELLSQVFLPGDFPLLDDLMNGGSLFSCPLDDPDLSFEDWKNLKCSSTEEPLKTSFQNLLLGVPLSIKGEIYGALIAKETNVLPAFQSRRLELIKGVAQQTTLAIQNEYIQKDLVDRERMEREFQLARQIQKTFLPETLPTHPNWQMDIRWQTAREVGGDFYDVFETKDKHIALVIADVADKGMPAALYMTVTRTLIRAIAQEISSPAKILERVNELLESESQNGMFVTAFFGLLNPDNDNITYANAGHNLPLIIRQEKHRIEHLQKDGIALGVIDNATYRDKQITLKPGDSLLIYTDGVTESFSIEGEIFNESRLKNLLLELPHDSATDLLTSILKRLEGFRNGEPPSDDLTMIAIHRNMQ